VGSVKPVSGIRISKEICILSAGNMKIKARVKKVWRIFHFRERFELPDTVRFDVERPLVYIRYYVGSGQDDESINFKRQIAACKASDNRHTLHSSFMDILEVAANHSRSYRGYLLDERFEPASISKIAEWVSLETEETGKILEKLEQIGLIEKVEWTPPPKLPADDGGRVRGRKSKSRARTRKSEKVRVPLNNKGNEKRNEKTKGKKKTGNKPEPEKEPNPKEASADAAAIAAESQENPKIDPKGSDAQVGHDKRATRINPPGQSFKRITEQPERLDGVLHRLFNPEAKEFAAEVYRAIGTPYTPDSQEGRSELACWLQAWADVQLLGLNPLYLHELWDKTINYAAKLRVKRNRIKWKRSPEALLRWMFKRYAEGIKRKVECARAAV